MSRGIVNWTRKDKMACVPLGHSFHLKCRATPHVDIFLLVTFADNEGLLRFLCLWFSYEAGGEEHDPLLYLAVSHGAEGE